MASGQRFIDWLSEKKYDAWQMLPLTPPDRLGSPYASPSAFAGWTELSYQEKYVELVEEEYWLEDWALYSAIKNLKTDRHGTNGPLN